MILSTDFTHTYTHTHTQREAPIYFLNVPRSLQPKKKNIIMDQQSYPSRGKK